MRLGLNLLAVPARLAGGRRVGRAAPGALGPAWRGQRDRLGTRLLGLGKRAGKKGGQKIGKNPTDRGKPGSKRHIVSDRGAIPLAIVLTAANVHDSKVFEEVVDAIEPIKRPGRGRPRKRPQKLHADKGYDSPRCRNYERRADIHEAFLYLGCSLICLSYLPS